jgi:undecaprenyl-diphosphatase
LFLAILPPWKPEGAADRKMIMLLALGTVPAVIAALLFKDAFERAYENPLLVSLLLLATGSILFLPKLVKRGEAEVGWRSSFLIGVGQAIAILPGISRSGSTIVAGMLSGVRSDRAAEFSFLLAIPAISGAAVLKAADVMKEGIEPALLYNYIAGSCMAFSSGLIAIFTVLVAVRRGRFEWFAYYCFAAGIGCFLWFKFSG